MTTLYRNLQRELRLYELHGCEIQVSRNATTEVLEQELKRIREANGVVHDLSSWLHIDSRQTLRKLNSSHQL